MSDMKKVKFSIFVLLLVGCAMKQERSFDIVEYPNPVLLRECADVAVGDDEISLIFRELEKKLYEDKKCVGLAAPQIGVSKKIAVIDIKEDGHNLHRLINPKIVAYSKDMSFSMEGCASMPGVYAKVMRHNSVMVEYLDDHFQKKSVQVKGFEAFCFQHEIDHLGGKMWFDRLEPLERDKFIKEYEQLQSSAKLKVEKQ